MDQSLLNRLKSIMSFKLMSAIGTITQVKSAQNSENSDQLLKQLLQCVQQCQKRYGGKKELATEFDSCVAGLCLTFERVFLHGLRTKQPSDNKPAFALKQVSEIVVNSLSNTSETLSFWPFVRKHLTRHEQERFAVLKHIWTDTGRGRAWIRAALNERSLERYCHIVLSNPELLEVYYEEWALLRDQEKNSLLPNMAAGVASILFAINIDKPELNNSITNRSESFQTKPEPIIEAPIPEQRDRQKKKRKVARQFISFDDDDNSFLSTSIPSSSSSISSESTDYKSKTLRKLMESQSTMDNNNRNDKLLQEIPETLTPVSQVEIGELTPVSVEREPGTIEIVDDEILEVPTDISAVLTAVETKNQEMLHKKQQKIDQLLKENEQLKQQVQKYVGAIRMLKSSDFDEELLKDLSDINLNSDAQPDYKIEAKIFEQKLVQVAEMHAELMDFNVMLQQSLSQKDALLERLRSELEALRGPMPTDDLSSGNVNVWIPSAFLTGTGSNSHHVYQIFLRAGNDEWNIYRRYAQFYALHTDLKKLDPEVGSFDFPPKKSIGKKDSALVEERRKRLQIYLRKIIAHWPELAHCNSRFLLEQHLPFFKDQKDDGKSKKGIFSARRSGNQSNDTNNHYTGL